MGRAHTAPPHHRITALVVDAPMAEASIGIGSASSGDATDDEKEDQPVDIKELTLRLLASDDDPSSSEADFARYVELPRFDSNDGEVLSLEEHQEMQNYFKSLMRAARPVASRLAFDRDFGDRSTSSLDANVGSPPRMVDNGSSGNVLSPISPGNASVGSNHTAGLDNESELHSAAEDMSILSSMDEGEWLETMTVLERQNIVRQLEAAERQNKLLQERLKETRLLNAIYKQERNEANDRSAVAEDRIRDMELYLKEAKIRQYELESENAGLGSLAPESVAERDMKVEELIKCKMELANVNDECDKTHQANQKLEKMLAKTKMELAHAKESQEDAEVKLEHALLMQQTALQELNLMRRQSVHGTDAR